MTAFTCFVGFFAILYLANPMPYYYSDFEDDQLGLNILVIGVVLLLLYLTIRFLGLPKRRRARNAEVWTAFGLAAAVGTLALMGSTALDPFNFNWNIPGAAVVSLWPWSTFVFSTDEVQVGLKLSFFLITLIAQLVWVFLLWPLALEAIHETRAAQ